MVRVPASLLVLLLVLSAPPPVGAKYAVSPLEPGPRGGTKGAPHLVAVEGGYLVVWSQSGTPTQPGWLAASIVDANGEFVRNIGAVKARQGLPLFPGTIAASGTTVMIPGECASPDGLRSVCVTWIDVRNGSISAPEVVAEDAIAPSAAWNGREFLLTYVTDPFGERMLRARVISERGERHPPIAVGSWHPSSHTPAVAADGESFYVAWTSSEAGSTLTQIVDGAIVASLRLDAPSAQPPDLMPHLSVAAAGGDVVVVTGHGSVRRFRGLTAVTGWASTGRSRHDVFHPRAVRTPGGWSMIFAASAEDTDVRAVPIATDGTLGVETSLGVNARSFSTFDTAPSESGVVLAWSRERYHGRARRDESDVVVGSFTERYAAQRQPEIVSIGVASQRGPVAAFGGGHYLVAWTERRGEYWQVRAQRFGLDGTEVGSTIEIPASAEDQIRPAVDFNGESFLLIWSEGLDGRSAVRGTRITTVGNALDRTPIAIAGEVPLTSDRFPAGPRAADVSWSGTSWIIATEGAGGIELRRVGPNGVVFDGTPVTLPRPGEIERLPVVHCVAGGECLVAWQSHIRWSCGGVGTCPTPPDSVAVVRVTDALGLLDQAPRLVTEPWDGPFADMAGIDLAWNESQAAWLVVWRGPAGRRVSRGGALLDPPIPVAGPGNDVSVLTEGEGWRVVWSGGPSRLGVFAAWTATGFSAVELRERFAVIAPPADEERDVYAAAGPRPLVLYVQARPELGGAHRVYARFVDEAQPLGRRRAVAR